jgi:hypothetical protein
MQMDGKRLRNPPLQIDTPPADHTVPLKVRTRNCSPLDV